VKGVTVTALLAAVETKPDAMSANEIAMVRIVKLPVKFICAPAPLDLIFLLAKSYLEVRR
jgi:hypothetical protein